jgi:hypothetical protein
MIRRDLLSPHEGRLFDDDQAEFEACTARLEAQKVAPMTRAERGSWREAMLP